MDPEPALEITGDSEAWFALLEAGEFARRWAVTEQAIAAETERAREELHAETPESAPRATHATLDASDD